MKEMMYSLRESLCHELENFAERGTINMGDLEVIHKLTDTIKNIYKIENLEEGGSSYYGGSYYGGMPSYGGSYGRYSYDNGRGDNSYGYSRNSRNGSSYGRDRGGQHYVRGHYSYSGDNMAEKIQEMMDRENMSQEDRNTLSKALDVLMG